MEYEIIQENQDREKTNADFRLIYCQEELDLIEAYLDIKDKSKKNQQPSALEKVRILKLIQTILMRHKECGLDRYEEVQLPLSILIRSKLSIFLGLKEKPMYELLETQRQIGKNMGNNISSIESAIEHTKDNLDETNLDDIIEFYKEMIEYKNMALNTGVLMAEFPQTIIEEKSDQVHKLSIGVQKSQQNIKKISQKFQKRGAHGIRSK